VSSTERFATRREAARLCGCSYDSIRRRQADGAWVIPLSDLVALVDEQVS
jgi:hypothetical protein